MLRILTPLPCGGKVPRDSTTRDRAVLLEMLEGDDLSNLFREIATEDFGPDAAVEMFGGDDFATPFGNVDAKDSGPDFL